MPRGRPAAFRAAGSLGLGDFSRAGLSLAHFFQLADLLDFALHQPLSFWAVEAVGRLGEAEAAVDESFDPLIHALNVLSIIESVPENPGVVLAAQLDLLRAEAIAEMKADGIPYEERMEELDKLEYPKPLGIKGEVALALSWAEPLDRPDPLLGIQSDRDQYGIETYWKLLLTPDIWITPGVQLVFEPTFNPSTDLVAIPQIKFRAFF